MLEDTEGFKDTEDTEDTEEKKVEAFENIVSKIYKSAQLGNPYLTAKYILILAEQVDNIGDSKLADQLTKIAQEAFE